MAEAASKDAPAAPDVLKIISVNANSIRRTWGKDLKAYIESARPDIFCWQSTEVSSGSSNTFHLSGYHGYFFYPTTEQPGLGTAVFTKVAPLSARTGFEDPDARVIVLEFTKFALVAVYFPSAGEQLEHLRQKLDDFSPKFCKLIQELQGSKPVIVAGDFNVAHKELDIYDAADHDAAAGYTADERSWFDGFLGEGFIDVFRTKHPDLQEFSYFGRRFGRKGRGHGWRIDYFLAAKSLEAQLVDSFIESSVTFSERAPIVLVANRDLICDDSEVDKTVITVLNTDETIEAAAAAEKPKKVAKKIDDADLQLILAERRTSERARKPVERRDFDEREEKAPKKTKVNFDEEEYGKPVKKKTTTKKSK